MKAAVNFGEATLEISSLDIMNAASNIYVIFRSRPIMIGPEIFTSYLRA